MSIRYEEDIISEAELTERERFEHKVLKIHNFLEGRRAKIISNTASKEKGWTTSRGHNLIGKTGIVTRVHNSILSAVEIKVYDNTRFWHYKDLELVEQDELPDPVFFNPLSLVV